jgi:hypothetical protein
MPNTERRRNLSSDFPLFPFALCLDFGFYYAHGCAGRRKIPRAKITLDGRRDS